MAKFNIVAAVDTARDLPLVIDSRHELITQFEEHLVRILSEVGQRPRFRRFDCSVFWHFGAFSRFVDVCYSSVIIVYFNCIL